MGGIRGVGSSASSGLGDRYPSLFGTVHIYTSWTLVSLRYNSQVSVINISDFLKNSPKSGLMKNPIT